MSNNSISSKFISFEELPVWLAALGASATVFAPCSEGQAVVYKPYRQGESLECTRRPTESAKHVLFPRSEDLFSFRKEGESKAPGNRKLFLEQAEDPGPAVLFGVLSCDARGFLAFDPVYAGSGTKGQAQDVYYLKRRDAVVLVVRACKSAHVTCFCHWTGGGPASTQGADVLATDVEGGLLLQAVTDRGVALLQTGALSDASHTQIEAAQKTHENAMCSLDFVPDLTTVPVALQALFDNQDFWLKQSAGCLSCGTCTYLCPTCYCFNVTDEDNGIAGTRLRSWDTCMSPLFTREASGHNPRQNKADRLKNRVGHKFSYYPGLHEERFSCCGCGRCIKSCPSSIDIRAIVRNAVKEMSNA